MLFPKTLCRSSPSSFLLSSTQMKQANTRRMKMVICFGERSMQKQNGFGYYPISIRISVQNDVQWLPPRHLQVGPCDS